MVSQAPSTHGRRKRGLVRERPESERVDDGRPGRTPAAGVKISTSFEWFPTSEGLLIGHGFAFARPSLDSDG